MASSPSVILGEVKSEPIVKTDSDNLTAPLSFWVIIFMIKYQHRANVSSPPYLKFLDNLMFSVCLPNTKDY